VEERDEQGKRRLTGGKGNDRGTPQGGVVSPGLANLYMNRMLKGFRQTRREEQFRARIVNYADDFVILSRGKAKEAREWTGRVLERLELTLNEKKTSIRNARQERFDFLGYTFGPHINPRSGRRYMGYSPSPKSVSRIRQKVGELLDRRNGAPWEEVRQKLNRKLQGWRQYFSVGATSKAYRAVDTYVYDRVRNFLRRRHKVSSQGTRQFPAERVYGPLGVFRLQGPRVART
jgi:RNA-directed DNA polymerase